MTLGPDEARHLLERELERSEYDGAQVTWWDRASRAVLDWLGSFRADGLGSPAVAHTLLWVAVVVLVAVIVLVVVARGLPRRRTRTAGREPGGVFDDDDLRTARAIADDARAALRAGDWSRAVLDGYRALARGLGERDLVPDVPGATARAIAGRASALFPAESDRLERAAATFDDVRYLGADATEAAAHDVLDTEHALRTARPVHATTPAVPA
ncbi:DUF4129 domain-containing protein [Curtobacterium pusillum]|uniref:DUF4129 domain-containing protein n=1 Tax=Curtobacterium pusillum TaxID=69373 RepID=UPI0011A8FF81|nr:DUF4129 domain-containing protein [Curtobacterium pusillum]